MSVLVSGVTPLMAMHSELSFGILYSICFSKFMLASFDRLQNVTDTTTIVA